MARIIRNNALTVANSRLTVSVLPTYNRFLRDRSSSVSESTYKIYEELGQRVIVPGLTDLTEDNMSNVNRDVLQLLVDDYAMDHKPGGVDFLFRHLRAFVNWYWDEYEIESQCPISKVKRKKCSALPRQGITHSEIDLLLKAAKKSEFPERNVALLMVLCDTGIRKMSLASLRIKDVDLAHCQMTVFEKDQYYHVKAFGTATEKALKKYLDCLDDVKPDDPLWLCMDGTALTAVGMREVLRRLCDSAKIPMHHFHDFRRFYALELYKATKDIYMVSRALDHKSIEITKRYLRIDELADQEVARSFSPMDRKFGQTGVTVKR